MRVLGFTGTRKGLSPQQRESLVNFLYDHQPTHFHHGACVGADEEAVLLIRESRHIFGDPIIEAHPGHQRPGLANPYLSHPAMTFSAIHHPPQHYFTRNEAIVDASDMVVACPDAGRARGGTWYTVAYAWRAKKPCLILWPDGGDTLRKPPSGGVLVEP